MRNRHAASSRAAHPLKTAKGGAPSFGAAREKGEPARPQKPNPFCCQIVSIPILAGHSNGADGVIGEKNGLV